MADPTQVVQYQTGLPPETALYGQQLLGTAAGLIYDYEKDASGKPIMVDPKTGQPTTDGTGVPQIKGFQPYQQYTGDRVAQFTPLQQQAMQAAGTLGVDPSTAAAARGLQSLGLSAAGTSYSPFSGTSPEMQGPRDATTQGISGATVNYGGYSPFAGTAPEMAGMERVGAERIAPSSLAYDKYSAFSGQGPSMRGPQDVAAQDIRAATGEYRPDLNIYQMGPAERVGTRSVLEGSNVEAYMSPYMQNVVDVQQREAKRQAAIAQQALGAQAARSGAFGGSGAALQRAQANAQLQRDLQGIQATGLQTAYQQGMQQFNTEQQARLQAALANQQAGIQTGSQNLAAALGVQQLGTQTGLQMALANLSNQQQAEVQNAANRLQAAGMNQQMAYQTALQNLQAGLQTQQLGEQSRQFGAAQGLQAATTNAQLAQQAAIQSEANRLQAAGMNQQTAYQTAVQNMQSRLQTQQLGEQSRQFGAGQGLQAAMQNASFAQQAAIQSEANRLQAQGMNQQAALATAQANLQARLQTQQLGEQSRQYGAGLGLQGIQTGISALQGAGQMGQTAFNQQQAAIGLQNTLGGQQQQQVQNVLNTQYQNFQDAQNLPYKQLGFMSDMIRGLPMSQTSSTMYQAPPSMLGVATGLAGAYLSGGRASGGVVGSYAEGGAVNSYADGGSVMSRENKEKIVGNMHPMGLPRAMQGAMMRGDMDTYVAAQANMAEDDAIRRGIAAAAPQDIGVGYARGGIVAFANGGTKEEEATSAAGDLWRSITGSLKGGVDKTAQIGELRRQMDENRVGFFESVTPAQRAERLARGKQLREEYDRLLGKTPAAPKITGDDQYNPDVRPGIVAPPQPIKKEAPAKIAPKIDNAITTMSEQSGVPKETLLDSYTALRSKIEAEGVSDRKEFAEMMKSFMGEGKKVREGATKKALQEFFLNMAASASQPGVARGRGLGQILQPAGAAAPTYAKSLNESDKLAREMDANDQKMMLMGKQFEMSQKAGDRKTAMELAMNMETIKRQQEQLQLERDKLNQLVKYQDRYIGVLSQKAAGSSGLQKAYLTGVSKAQDRAARIAKDNWGNVVVQNDLKKQGFQSFDQYYDYLVKKEMKRAVPISGVTPASEDDED